MESLVPVVDHCNIANSRSEGCVVKLLLFHRRVSTGCFVINTDTATCRQMVTLTLVALTIEILSQTNMRCFFWSISRTPDK